MKEEQDDNGCKLKIYSKRNKRAPVFIADFSHGEVKNCKTDLKFQSFKKDTSANNVGCDAIRELVATNGRLNYIGSSTQSALKYFVGVRSKTTGKMKIYDCVLFRIKPDLKNVGCSNTPTTSKSYWEGINELTQNFGSKAKKRALNTLQKCTVDASLDESLMVNDSFLLPSPDRFCVDDVHRQIDYLPPQNRNAAVPNEVFDINDIISSEEDDDLNKEAQELLTAPGSEFIQRSIPFCKYVETRFRIVDATKQKLLLYYNYLIRFQHLKYNDIRKRDPAPEIRNPYKKYILEKFTLMSFNDKGKESRSCPNQMKDKLVSYILVLALFIDEFKINLDEIHVDLNNVGVPKLKTIAEVLGCNVSKKKCGQAMANFAELKIPLNDTTSKFSKKPNSKKF
ncbi:DNA-directed RNA polymerase I subunit RPA49-like [Argiope bruennichi]|uniref:DNA-directed RNA polymerase I subunit RPA49-like n=1 Tax=Argiope bruennichi TaxID=94029 RepID=UPI0024941774|nr:DNA-directed RNA polymerase I subunit RPA49-like [Argiope bruennichi]